MKKVLLAASLALLLVLSVAGPALAGEVTGSGKGGPNGDGVPGAKMHGKSACLYSGLEDFDNEQAPEPGQVQNWGHSKDAPFILDSRGASWVLIDATVFGAPPGTTVEEGCNPHSLVDDPH